MGVLLLVLKILGIALLGILGLALLVLLCVLLVPVRYRMEVEYEGGKPKLLVRFSWMFPVFGIRAWLDEKWKPQYAVRILGYLLMGSGKKKRAKKGDAPGDGRAEEEQAEKPKRSRKLKKGTEAAKEEKAVKDTGSAGRQKNVRGTEAVAQKKTGKDTGPAEGQKNAKGTEAEKEEKAVKDTGSAEGQKNVRGTEAAAQKKTGKDMGPAGDQKRLEGAAHKKMSKNGMQAEKMKSGKRFSGKIQAVFQKAGNIFRGIGDKIKNIRKKIFEIPKKVQRIKEKPSRLLSFFQSSQNHKGFGSILLFLKKVLNHSKPRKLRGRICFGFQDPAATGKAYGLACMLFCGYGPLITVVPDFERQVIEGNLWLRGRIRMGSLAWMFWRLWRDAAFKGVLSEAKKLKEE